MIELKSLINCMRDLGLHQIKSRDVYAACKGDVRRAEIQLLEWQTTGWVRILKLPIESDSDEFCVESRRYIDNEAPQSDPMSGRM
jgi:hypothetical protein